jgi:hypothetical protein
MYTPHISAAPTLGVRKNMFFIHPKMFYSYTRNRHKNMLVRFLPNKCSKFLQMSLLKVSIAEKEAWTMQELFIKEKESIKKIDKCPRYLKQLVLRCLPEKKKERREE